MAGTTTSPFDPEARELRLIGLNAPARELLAAIVESSDDGIASKTLQGIVTSWNPGAERIFGYPASEIVGKSISILFPPERLDEETHFLTEIAAGRRVEHFDTERVRKDGSRIFVSVTLSPVRDINGVIVGASKVVRDITDRVRAAEALRESRDVLALAMRGGRMGSWSLDLASDHVQWSRELEDLFGLAPGGFQGGQSEFRSFIHADDQDRVDDAIAAAVATGNDYVVEFRFRHASGEWRWMEGRGRGVYGDDGTARSLYGIGIDITERKTFEDALASARDAADSDASRLSLALAAARLGDWSWNVATDLVTFSARAAQIFDIPADPHISWTAMRELLHPDDRERARLAVEHAIETQSGYSIEYRLVNSERERWVSVSGRTRYDDNGHATGMFGVVQDITRDRLLVHVDDAVRPLTEPDEVTYTAAKILGQHLRVNRCAYAAVEADEDAFAVTGNYINGVSSIVGHYRFRQFGAECLRLMRAGRPYVVDDVNDDPRIEDEERQAYRACEIGALICAPILKSGRLVASMAVHTNAPREWRVDEIEMVQQLASRCWESIERARAERERAGLLDAAQSANRSKDEFMAMLGHELRNPLSPILTALQLMKLRGGSGADRERAVIERQVAHLTRLVDDLLDVSRIARGKVDLKRESVEMAEIVARAVEIASPLLEERAHTLTLEVPRTGLPVDADVARLAQVVSNLLTNAAKYTPRGGRVTVSANADTDGVVLRVRDTGIGLSPEMQTGAFELFVQGPQALDRAQGGLGLGLTIVKSLVERHGGRVEARSDGPNRGSEFVVWLPRAQRQPVAANMSAADSRQVTAAGVNATRVLIVDDNEDAADSLAEALRHKGFETAVAHDGPEALRVAATFEPDAACLDLGLPVMDGYELATRLRELPGLQRLRLVAVTGYGQDSDRKRTRAAGFDHHIVKPVDLGALELLVARTDVA